ncbi:MAG: hypothetical protein HC860_13910 [Alkalinema sp. RU_4_3]|nr:hypothetical protein [Alkalinema sp. RU_4_3]
MFLTIFGIGIAQVIYLVPLGLYLNHRGKHELVKGMAIGGLITALLNGACFAGVTLTNYSGYGLPTLFFTMLAALIIILCVIILLLLNLK